jgi:peroxiredoxin
MMNTYGGRCLLFWCLIIVLVEFFTLSVPVFGDNRYMEKLGILAFDEKTEAPDFTLENLEGKKVSLKDYRGKVVFLNFWATWCPPCRLEMPSMNRLYNEYKDKGLVILAINLRENADRARTYRDQEELDFPILLDRNGEVGLMFGVRSIPATYLIDRTGTVIGGALGPRDWAGRDAFKLIDHLLDTTSPT